MTVFPFALTAVLLVAFGIGVRRVLRWAARRGWIYYGKDRPPAGAGGTALMEWAAIFEPEIEYVLEEQRSGDLRLVHSETGEPVDLRVEESRVDSPGDDDQSLAGRREGTEGR